jgi:hypothetical protein
MRSVALIITASILVILSIFPTRVSATLYGYGVVTTIPLNTVSPGHGDWVDFDPGTNDIYLSEHTPDVAVISTTTNSLVTTIVISNESAAQILSLWPPLLGNGILNGIAHDSNYLYVTAGGSLNELVVISKSNWQIVDRVKTNGTTPDGVWVDTTRSIVVLASDDMNQLEVYTEGASPQLKAIWPLLPTTFISGPDVGVLVPSKGVLYWPDDALVERLNLDTGKVMNWVNASQTVYTLPLTATGGTKNMFYDAQTNRLWVATTSHKIFILDADTLATIGWAPTTAGADEVSVDPGMRLLYSFSSSARGFDVFDLDTMQPVASVDTLSVNTHTGIVNPTTHYVYAYEGNADQVGVYTPFGLQYQLVTWSNPTPYALLALLLVSIVAVGYQIRRTRRPPSKA